MKKLAISLVGLVFLAMVMSPSLLSAQDEKPYKEGTVWDLTFVKLKANMGSEYLKGISKTWAAAMQQLQDAKLIKSYKILMGSASNPEDFDLILMTEVENLAALDPNPEKEKKQDEIEKKLRDSMGDEFQKTVESYTTMREITGHKFMREIFLNN